MARAERILLVIVGVLLAFVLVGALREQRLSRASVPPLGWPEERRDRCQAPSVPRQKLVYT